MKQSKFLLCENPMLKKTEEFVLHTNKPSFLAKVYYHGEKKDQDDFGKKLFKQNEDEKLPTLIVGRSNYKKEYFTLVAINVYTKVEVTEDVVQELAVIIRQMADWYRMYLKFEDE